MNKKYFVLYNDKCFSTIKKFNIKSLNSSIDYISNIHFKNAFRYINSNNTSDYRNVVKECMCALESLMRNILKENSFKQFEKNIDALSNRYIQKEFSINSSFCKIYKQLYHFASCEGGIRHGTDTISEIDKNTATFIYHLSIDFYQYILAYENKIKCQEYEFKIQQQQKEIIQKIESLEEVQNFINMYNGDSFQIQNFLFKDEANERYNVFGQYQIYETRNNGEIWCKEYNVNISTSFKFTNVDIKSFYVKECFAFHTDELE